MATSLKRHAPDEFDDVDSENVDPLLLSSPSKKGRTFDFDFSKSAKPASYVLTPAKPPAQYIQRAQNAGQKRKVSNLTATPSSELQSSQRTHPSSAPVPAGRSPKSKKAGILSRRRMTGSPFTRINPPAFATPEPNAGLPFSIDAALAGSVPNHKPKSKTQSTNKKSWHFEIHEDTPDAEMTNLLDHSTCTLDISDDESRAAAKGDQDNKENVPPVDGPTVSRISAQIPSSRRDMMTDTARSPLGDLEAAEFYAEGCDASSAFIVGPDDATDNTDDKCAAPCNQPDLCSPARPRANAVSDGHENWKDIIAQLAPADSAAVIEESSTYVDGSTNTEPAEIQIWESESAKGDDEEPGLGHKTEDDGHQPFSTQ